MPRIFCLWLLVVLLAAALTSAFAAPPDRQLFEGQALAQGTGKLVEDPDARHPVWQVENEYHFGAGGDPEPGLYRLTLRLKRTAPAAGSLRLGLTSGTGPGAHLEDLPPVTPEDLPEPGLWYEITRLGHFRQPGHFSSVNGSWPGLRLDRITLERVREPVVLEEIHTDRLLYRIGQPGQVSVRLVNTTAQPQSVQLRVRVESGLDQSHAGGVRRVTLPAATPERRLNGTDGTAVSLPLPPLAEYGNAVVVQALQGGKAAGELREYCYASNHPLQVGQYFGWRFPGDYTCSNAPELFAEMRRTYFPVAECFFWAPCDDSLLAPDTEKWWSGQTLLRLSKKPLQEMIRQGHEQGYSFLSYATRWGFGWRMWEFARRHPDLVQWDVGTWQPSYDVGHMEIEERERDAEHPDLGSSGVLTGAWGNPEAVQYHVRQLQASMRMFGWDGFRYDNGSPVLDEVEDIFGRALPLPGWTHARVIAALREGIRQGKPEAVYGNNTGWNLDVDSQPRDDDPYTQQIRDGGLVMQEGETNGAFPHRTFAEEASRYARAGYNALRFGGHQVNIIDPNLTGPDHFFQAALTLAGSCHIAYHLRDELRPLMQLVCRHCDLFYGDGLHFILRPPTPVVEIQAPDHVLWREFVRYRQVAPARRQYLVHLFNAPAGKLGENKDGRYPEPVRQLETSWSLPPGWKTTAAYALTADGGYQKQPLPFQLKEGKVAVTLPQLRRWSIVVLDATGPAASARVPRKAPAAQSPASGTPAASGTGPSLTGPAMVMSPGKEGSGTSTGIRHLPGQADPLRRAAEFKIAGADLVQVPGASGGSALRVGLAGLGGGIGFSPVVSRPGRYRLVIRAMSLAPPPAGANLHVVVMAGVNKATPGAREIYNNGEFRAPSFPRSGEWTALATDAVLTYPGYWCAITGGWDGLVLDTLRLERVKELSRDELARQVESRWPERLSRDRPARTGGEPRAWFGAGLYYRLTGLPEALSALHVRADMAKAWRYRGPVGFSQPFPRTPDELAGYDLVILADCEARSLSPEQQLWLDGYVRSGGRLILAGGPYGLGCGGWADTTLLKDLMPVTLTPHDLRFAGRAKPVTLQPASDAARRVDWSARPVLLWEHALQPKPGAVVHVTAGGAPVVISGACGQGNVLVVAAPPLGEAPNGATPFWEWPGWRQLMTGLVGELLAERKTAAR